MDKQELTLLVNKVLPEAFALLEKVDADGNRIKETEEEKEARKKKQNLHTGCETKQGQHSLRVFGTW